MTQLTVWPGDLPEGLRDLPAQVATILGVPAAASADLASMGDGGPVIVVITGAVLTDAGVFADLDGVVTARTAPTVVVVGDGFLGTDGPDVASSIAGASAVALARSIAVRRTPTGRVNVVCVPERLVGESGSQRGPLKLDIASGDVAEVVAFALSDESAYIDGQVLYADGGRQLFSSLTA